mgnify:CR=1 FL=1
MALLSLANVVLSFGDRHILDGVNLTLDMGEHVGMVGRNGCGKSTLMKLIAGLGPLKPDAGQIQLARGATAGYLTQDPVLDPENTLREEAATAFAHLHKLHEQLDEISHQMASAEGDELEKLLKKYEQVEHQMEAAGGYAVDHKIDATLHGLGLTDEFFSVKVKDLSGGQKGRLALAKLLLSNPDLLLLDEPTNHLDIAGRQWLEGYLSTYRGAVILISHDRWLLDRVVSKIVELQDGVLEEYPGNYAKYRELRAERMEFRRREYEKQRERIKAEQAFIDRYRAGQRASQAQGREKRLERFKRDNLLDKPVEMDDISIRLRPTQRCGDLVLTAEHLTKVYDNKPLFKNLSLVIKRGDRVGVIGPNGAGKSTLIRCLLGEQQPDGGSTKVGPSVNVGHYHQSHDHLDPKLTVVDYLRLHVPSQTEQEARDLAGAFLFSGQEQDKPMSVLSGGERGRAVLAGLVVEGHNVLVLDEPTNHLDIFASERLEEMLRQFTAPIEGFGQNQVGGGTLILITHDRMLLENLVNQLLILDGHGGIKHFSGTYSEYVAAQQAQEALLAAQTAAKPAPKPAAAPKPQKVETPAPSKSSGGGALSKMSQEALEAKIVQVETKLAQVDQELADPDVYRDGAKVRKLQDQRQRLQNELSPLEEEWARRAE